MARTIYQRIALEGGKGIADELRKIGKDGEAAFVEIRGAAAKLSKDMGALGGAFKNLGGSLATVGKRLGIAGAAAVGAAAGVVAFAKAGTDAADNATKQAQALGLAVDEYGRLSFAAEQSGVDAGTFSTAITRLNQEIGKAADGNKNALAKFQELGVSIRDAGGNIKPTEQLLKEMADRFAALPDGAEKSALAVEFLGRSGAQLIPFLNGGAEAINNLGREAERLGVVFTPQDALNAEAMNDALSALSKGFQGTRFQLGLLFAPTITNAARGFQGVLEDNRQALQDFVEQGLNRALPIVDDFIAAILGRDQDVQNPWVLDLRDAFLEFAESVKVAVESIIVPAYELIISAADRVAEAINGLFGTDFTGQQIIVAAAIAKLIGLFGLLGSAIGVVVAVAKTIKSAFALGALIKAAGGFSLLAAAVKSVGVFLAGLVSIPALVIAALVAAAVAIYVYWDEIKAAAGVAWEFIKTKASEAKDFIAEKWGVLKESLGQTWEGIKTGASDAWAFLKAGFAETSAEVQSNWETFKQNLGSNWDSLKGGTATIWEELKGGFANIATEIGAGWAIFKNGLGGDWDLIQVGLDAVLFSLRDSFKSAINFIGNLFDGLASRIERVWNRIKSIIASAKAQYNQINENNTGTSSQREGFATGGMVRGPGTGTSDSILARLSDGEFVVRAAAVRKYGPQFLAAINAMRFKMPKFATGGMVSMPKMPRFNVGGLVDSLTTGMQYQVPRFAEGGMVAIPAQAQGRPVTLNIDGRTFDGLTASEKTAEDLSRYATNRRLKSAGRKPGWVGG